MEIVPKIYVKYEKAHWWWLKRMLPTWLGGTRRKLRVWLVLPLPGYELHPAFRQNHFNQKIKVHSKLRDITGGPALEALYRLSLEDIMKGKKISDNPNEELPRREDLR